MAERETVEAKQLSLGHWFESGWSETFLFTHFLIFSDLNSRHNGLIIEQLVDIYNAVKYEKIEIILNKSDFLSGKILVVLFSIDLVTESREIVY